MRRNKPKKIIHAINHAVDALPIELYLPHYRFCGPGTKLEERLACGERGINELDEACREHDIAYAKYKDKNRRHIADRVLADKAWKRVKGWDLGVSERAYAAAVAAAMKAKSALGGGCLCSGCGKKKKGSGIKSQSATKLKTTSRHKRKNAKHKIVSHDNKIATGLYLRPYKQKNLICIPVRGLPTAICMCTQNF